MICIGIDPGLSGAVAFLPAAGEPRVFDMPTVAYSKTGAVKRALDVNGLAAELRRYKAAQNLDDVMSREMNAPTRQFVTVFLERVNAFPGQGVSSMFSLGMSFWGVAGVAAALGLPLELVTPMEWKAHFKLNSDKDMARGLAARLYPSIDLSKKKDHGRAEALLIARYGREKLTAA